MLIFPPPPQTEDIQPLLAIMHVATGKDQPGTQKFKGRYPESFLVWEKQDH